jgi:uncharacterized protein (TIGR02453 family)
VSRSGNGFTETSFDWFAGLRADNSTEWFAAHRDTYEDYVREPFVGLLEELTVALSGTSMPLRGGPRTMFRINRDLRFTDDPRPYSEQVSGLLTPNGTKDESGPLLYLMVGADGGMVGGGMHRPKAAALKPIRQRILDEPERWDDVVIALHAVDADLDRSEAVKTMPRGFAHAADHRHADVIALTQLVAFRELPKTAFLDDTVVDRVLEYADGVAPLYRFIGHDV